MEMTLVKSLHTIKYLFQTEVPSCLQAFLPAMIEKKAGHVVNIASLAGHSGTNKLVKKTTF